MTCAPHSAPRSCAPCSRRRLRSTDGLTEARRKGEFFGLERVNATLAELFHPTPGQPVDALRARVEAFTNGALTDDLCLLAARVD